jgi:hypothetical protein
VQTITSSISSITGSTNFGSLSSNTHQFTGSMLVSGSSTAFRVNASDLFVSSSGQVGIGTIIPTYKLDVSGTGRFTGAITIGTDFAQLLPISTANYQLLVGNYYDGTNLIATATAGSRTIYNIGSMDFRTFTGATVGNSVTDTSRMTITSAGNVGIGTSSPATALDVVGSLSTRTAGSTGAWYIKDTSAANKYEIGWEATTNNFYIYSYGGSLTPFRITSAGQVLVNTTSVNASGLLSINANVDLHQGITIKSTGTQNGLYYIYFTNSSGGAAGSILQTSSTTVSYGTSSDYRLKEDLKDFNGLDILSNIKFYDFKWKDEDIRMHGVVAHELETLLPLAVSGTKDKIDKDGNIVAQGVDYSKIVPVIGKALQEAIAKIEEQQIQIQSLQEQINILSK